MSQIIRRLKDSPWRRIVWRRSAGAQIVPFSDIRRRIFAQTNIRGNSTILVIIIFIARLGKVTLLGSTFLFCKAKSQATHFEILVGS